MASSKARLEEVLHQLSGSEGIGYRAMMGEYLLYRHGKVIGGIYDDRFLVKPVKGAADCLSRVVWETPYPGGKQMLLVGPDESAEHLALLLRVIQKA